MSFAGGNDQKLKCHILTVKQMVSVIYGFFHTEYTTPSLSRPYENFANITKHNKYNKLHSSWRFS